MRFKNKEISYFIDVMCSDERANDARDAFKLLQENTILQFYEINSNGQIEVSCSDSERKIDKDYVVEIFYKMGLPKTRRRPIDEIVEEAFPKAECIYGTFQEENG